MEEQIYKCRRDGFPFEDLSLANPQGLQGGAYLSKLKVLGKRLVLQTPRCTTKNGIHKTDKKIYCDLMFDTDHDEVREFFRQLSDKIKNLINENNKQIEKNNDDTSDGDKTGCIFKNICKNKKNKSFASYQSKYWRQTCNSSKN